MATLPDTFSSGYLPDPNLLPGAAAQKRQRAIEAWHSWLRFAFFAMMAIGITVFQKIGIGPDPDTIVPVIIPMMMAGITLMTIIIRPRINPVRLGLYLFFITFSILTTGLFAAHYSVASVALYAVLYLPMVFTFAITNDEYKRYLDFFISVMVVMAGIEILQHAVQIIFSWHYWPNLNQLLPEQILIPYFNYIQPIVWGMPYMKPNAVFFLEVSFLSQFLMLALAAEVVFFHRTWRIALFTAGIFATFAGTGLLLMALTLPVLLGRMSIRTNLLVLGGIGVVGVAAIALGWFDLIFHRLDEFNRAGASGNMRFVVPYERIAEFLSLPGSAYSGIGAGQIEKAENFQFWPISKAIIEYGLLPGIAFYAFFLYAMFDNPPSRRIAYTLVIWFSFEGALLTAVNPITCALLSSLFIIRRPVETLPHKLSPQPYAMAVASKASAPLASPPSPPSMMAPPRKRTSSQDLDYTRIAQAVKSDGSVDTSACYQIPDTEGRRIYAIGDIHGRADLLAPMLEFIRQDGLAHPSDNGQKPLLVFLGDYIDRGMRSRETIDAILDFARSPDFEVHCLLGNHEEAMLDFLDKKTQGATWGHYGGRATLTSYNVDSPASDDRKAWNQVRDALLAAIPPEHVDFLLSLEESYMIGDLLFVHAGIRPGIAIADQQRRDLLFIRSEFLENPIDCGKLVVHGHTPAEKAYGAPGRIGLDSGAYASGVLSAALFAPGHFPVILEARVSGVRVL